MNRTILRLALAAAQLTAWPSFAQGIRPGWWEMNNRVSAANAETDLAMSMVLQQLANLSPAQRQTMEQLAASHGVTMPTVSTGGAIFVTACVTPDMSALRQLPTGQPGACTSNNVAVAGGMKMAFTCANPPSSGQGKLSFIGDTGFTMTMNINTSARGQPEQMTVDTTGKWVGAACPANAR